MKFSPFLMSVILLVASVQVEAARMGGGKSMGRQSSNVTQKQAAPNQSAQPANSSQAAAAPKSAPAAAPAAAPKRPWGAMLGGLAAGLGLAWLAHSMGMGEGFGNILMIALFAFAAFAAYRWFMRSRSSVAQQPSPFAMERSGGGDVRPTSVYRPENVGNDASARPFERNMGEETSGSRIGSGIGSGIGAGISGGNSLVGSQSWGVPAGFDTESFLQACKSNFITLQAAWDRSDIGSLRSMMTDSMLLEIRSQLADREAHTGTLPNLTEVVTIEAHLLGIEETSDDYLASVEFSGVIRESQSAGPNPFREVWNMTKPKDGMSGWLVAGVQALQ